MSSYVLRSLPIARAASATPVARPVRPERDASLDAARGVLMILGVVLHTSNIYGHPATWIIADAQQSTFFTHLSAAIHVFRMPAFFWISGFFFSIVACRPGGTKVRLRRLVVPMLTCWVTLNVLQDLLIARNEGIAPLAAIADGVGIGHLWFLVDLVVLSIAAHAAYAGVQRFPALARLDPRGWRWLTAAPLPLLIVLLAIGSNALELAIRATGFAYVAPLHLTHCYRLSQYLPYFVAGILMAAPWQPALRFVQVTPWAFLVGILLARTAGLLAASAESLVIRELLGLVVWAGTWLSVAGTLSVFRLAFAKGSRLASLLADASYSVYLVHHIIVVALGMTLAPLSIGPFWKFGVVVTLTTALALTIHLGVIKRSRLLLLLFNGRA